MSEPATSKRRTVGAITLASAGVVACGVCCALPFALPAVALAGSGGLLAWFGGAQGLIAIAAITLVLISWGWVALRSARTKRRPAASTLIALSLATLVLVVSVLARVFPLG